MRRDVGGIKAAFNSARKRVLNFRIWYIKINKLNNHIYIIKVEVHNEIVWK